MSKKNNQLLLIGAAVVAVYLITRKKETMQPPPIRPLPGSVVTLPYQNTGGAIARSFNRRGKLPQYV